MTVSADERAEMSNGPLEHENWSGPLSKVRGVIPSAITHARAASHRNSKSVQTRQAAGVLWVCKTRPAHRGPADFPIGRTRPARRRAGRFAPCRGYQDSIRRAATLRGGVRAYHACRATHQARPSPSRRAGARQRMAAAHTAVARTAAASDGGGILSSTQVISRDNPQNRRAQTRPSRARSPHIACSWCVHDAYA